jgi:hypothetical protein
VDRHGKKAKARPTTVNSERSDLKAQARGPLDQLGLGARARTAPRGATGPGTRPKSAPKPR